jgi:hypothetical protein
MSGQFLLEPEPEPEDAEFDPEALEVLGVLEVVPLPDDEVVPLELVLDVLVAALAASAPPVRRPAVSAVIAAALRKWSFMMVSFLVGGTPSLCDLDLWVGPEARHNAIGVRRGRCGPAPGATWTVPTVRPDRAAR